VLLQFALALDNGRDEPCAVYEMSSGAVRERSVSADGKIANLFQGAAPVTPKELRGSIYPGDQSIHAADMVSVQVHNLRLLRDDVAVAENVPVLAIWIPPRLSRPWLIQRQPSQADG